MKKAKIAMYYIKTKEGYFAGEGDVDYEKSTSKDVAYFDGGRSSFFGVARGGYSGVSKYLFTNDIDKAESRVISGLGELVTQIAYRQNKGYISKGDIEIIRKEK